MSLPRHLRLTSRREFESVRTEGRSHRGRWLVLGVLHAPDLSGFKAGIIVPKALGNAVLRNRIKRRLRQIIRRSAPQIGPHLKLVMLARRGTAEADAASLEKDWLELARKAGILNSPMLA